MAIAEKALGPEQPNVATTLDNFAGLLRQTGRDDRAAKVEARVKEIRSKNDEQNPVQ